MRDICKNVCFAYDKAYLQNHVSIQYVNYLMIKQTNNNTLLHSKVNTKRQESLSMIYITYPLMFHLYTRVSLTHINVDNPKWLPENVFPSGVCQVIGNRMHRVPGRSRPWQCNFAKNLNHTGGMPNQSTCQPGQCPSLYDISFLCKIVSRSFFFLIYNSKMDILTRIGCDILLFQLLFKE